MSDNVRHLNQWLVLLYSGVQRSSHQVSESLVGSFGEKPYLMHEMTAMAREGRSLLESGGEQSMIAIGRLLHESWRIKGELNDRAISPHLLELYEAALRSGAIGGKVSGAGGGGFLLFVVPPEQQASFVQDMSSLALHVPFRFVEHGSETILSDRASSTDYATVEGLQR
jgi:D-glycero-alpha-D-manno-heptose-7-phosphate kinase